MSASGQPHRLPANHVRMFYAGGERIDRFRREPGAGPGPEDWVASVTALPAEALQPGAALGSGISALPDGTSLRDAVLEDAGGWLGPDLGGRWPGQTGLLVKLLDAGQRLPVHCHPSRPFAAEHLASPFGKTEGWIVMDEAPGREVWLGFREEVPLERLRDWIARQAVDEMLAAMNLLPTAPGRVFYVPAGVPHALGEGIMITELQEPTAFSILAEHTCLGLDETRASLGLGWPLASQAFDRSSYAERLGVLMPEPRVLADDHDGRVLQLFPDEAAPFFQALRVTVKGSRELPHSFAVLVVESGEGTLAWAEGEAPVTAGETWVVPYGAGTVRLAGELRAICCLPPHVD